MGAPDYLAIGPVACEAGRELAKLFAKLGIHVIPDCPCESRAAEMDRLGCHGCRENLDKIVGWLREEYDRRRQEHTDRLAAHRADPTQPRPTPLPLALRLPCGKSRWVLRHVVRLAIWRAERARRLETGRGRPMQR